MEIAIVFLMAMGLCWAGPTLDYCNVATCTATSGKTALCGNAVSRLLLLHLQWFAMVYSSLISLIHIFKDLSTWGPKCGDHSASSAFLPEDQQFIVDLHNQWRNQIAQGNVTGQPAASNMRKMVCFLDC